VANHRELISRLHPIFEKYNVQTAYLFGSRADGSAYPDSDYDIACLFDNYDSIRKDYDFVISLQMELEEALAPVKIDLVILNKASIIMRFNIIKHGVILYCNDDDKRTDFEDIVIRDYLDFKPFIDRFDRDIEEAIQGGNFFA